MDQSNRASTGSESGLDPAHPPAIGPFVVNLCASVAPLELKAASLPGLERYRIYQVRRVEDDRARYRLRLGFFADEAAAEIVLAAIREFYPAAFSVPAASDDLKHAPDFAATAKTGSYQRLPQATTVAKAPASPAVQPLARPPVPHAPAAPTPPAQKAPAPVPVPVRAPLTAVKATAIAPPAVTGRPILIDSTQTLRMLTEAELADSDAPLWFALQLAVSDQPINLDTMPKLDIFSAFRLYSIATPSQGKILHSLRLGFFREAVSAEAVCGYLKTFFGSPAILRISAAEQTRFADPPAPPLLHEKAGKSARIIPLHENVSRTPKTAAPPVLSQAVAAPRKDKAATPKAPVRAAPALAVARKTQPVGKPAGAGKRSLNALLQEEARQVVLSESGIRRMEQKGSLLSRLVGKLTK